MAIKQALLLNYYSIVTREVYWWKKNLHPPTTALCNSTVTNVLMRRGVLFIGTVCVYSNVGLSNCTMPERCTPCNQQPPTVARKGKKMKKSVQVFELSEGRACINFNHNDNRGVTSHIMDKDEWQKLYDFLKQLPPYVWVKYKKRSHKGANDHE